MIIPAQRRPATTPSQLIHQLLRAAWQRDYVAVPRDALTSRPTVLLTPITGVQADRRGRLHLDHGADGLLRWHWSDTDQVLAADPTDLPGLLAEIDRTLRGGDQS